MLPAARSLPVQTQSRFFKKARERLAGAKAGHPVRQVTSVSLESVSALLAVLTVKRYESIQAVKKRGSFESIEALASAVHRDRAAVSRDLRALAKAGLIEVQ